jgi:hypothetical protein
MSSFPPVNETWMVTLECLSHLPGPRYLDGRVLEGKTGVAANTGPNFSGTWWAVTTLAPRVVKFRCMTHLVGPPSPNQLQNDPRFLNGHASDGSVDLARVRANPSRGERWEVREYADHVTLRCLDEPGDPRHRFLDGRTTLQDVRLAPHTNTPYSGTHWRVRKSGRIVVLQSLAKGVGPRFLDGRMADHQVVLADMPIGRMSGTRWLLEESNGVATLKCLAEMEGDRRFLEGVSAEAKLRLAADTSAAGTKWRVTLLPHPHADVEPGELVTLRIGPPGSPQNVGAPVFLDANVAARVVTLGVTASSASTWLVLAASLYFEPCALRHDTAALDRISGAPEVVSTRRVAQLTGAKDPELRPLINPELDDAGVPGLDLGANTEHAGKVFFFFGDVVQGSRDAPPVVDADLVAYTADQSVSEKPGEAAGFRLHAVVDGTYFDPFRVIGPSGIGVTETFEVPSGAFSHGGKAYVFFHIWDSVARSPRPTEGCYLASKADPGQPGPFTERFLFSPRLDREQPLHAFGGVAPVKVRNAEHAWLPPGAAQIAEEGLVLFGIGSSPYLGGYSAVHLGWMPLTPNSPRLNDVRYFSRGDQWRELPDQVDALFGKAANLQSISAAYIKKLNKWIVLHMTSNGLNCMNGPIVARIGTPPRGWSKEFRLFDPCREAAYGKYMHWPELDTINRDDPDRTPGHRLPEGPGTAYGAFLVDRFTRWNPWTGNLDLYYLLSFGSPYQVQLMHSRVRLEARMLVERVDNPLFRFLLSNDYLRSVFERFVKIAQSFVRFVSGG